MENKSSVVETAEAGDLAKIKELVECGADNNAKNEYGSTALMLAARNGYIEVVRYLAEERGADVNAASCRTSALTRATEHGHIEVVRYLAEHGADVNATDEYGSTAVMWAARNGHIEVVRYLVDEHGADVNIKTKHGRTALMNPAAIGMIQVVRYLAERGAHVNAKDQRGCTALMMAAEYGRIEVVRYLVGKHRADVNATDCYGHTALMKAADNKHSKVAQYLAEERSADVNIKAKYGFTALMSAAAVGMIHVVRILAEHGADVNATNDDGYTALMMAAGKGRIEVVRYLAEERDADVNATNDDGYTALMMAAGKGRIEVVRYLAEERGAGVNAKTTNGYTAIRLAADRGHQEIQRILTPFLLPPQPHTRETTATAALTSDPSSSWFIPPSEIALTHFIKTGNVGGEYRAKWLDTDAVVKLFIPDASHSAFEDEVRLWHQLRHPNVIKMYGACDAGLQLQFFVCEYASNGSLIEHVRSTSVEERRIWKYLHQAALGLEYLHERRIVYSDLRCSNILIGSDGLSKLSNFGLSGSTRRSSLASSAVGSMQWQSPEVLEGKPSSFASDVYSLGMCILEAVTGKMPWEPGDDGVVRVSKEIWTPETGAISCIEPKCPPGDVRDLVWCMCCQDPDKRASLSSVVYELERLAIKESSNNSQPEHKPANTFDNYKCGETKEVWMDVQKRMKKCDSGQYHQTFDELKKVRERLQDFTHHSKLLARFHTLLTEFRQTITMSTDQARIMRLSSTHVITNSVRTYHRRIESLWAALGESVDAAKEREARWEKQRSEQIEFFVSEVSKTYLLLKELKSAEERLAFLAFLKTEMDRQSEYTPGQLEVMKKAYEDIASKPGTDDLSEFTPEWFIPWYELIVDRGCLGIGGFGSVYRAKWLDSEVVVKELNLVSSSGGNDETSIASYLSQSSVKPATTPAPTNPTKRAKALAMFRREVDIWFGFSHPHVVRLFGACHVGRPFFVCEYATNGTLVSYLRKYPDQLWTKLHEAALGVQYLHARNVVHGDLKGNNIVIGSDMKAKVTDFGLSSITSDDDKVQISGASHWVAPECFETDTQPTFASDVYSLGMCVVEALRVVEAAQAGKDTQCCLPWGSLDNDVVKHYAKKGELPLKPETCEANQWELVKRMCELEPKKRIKISTVVDELTRLANMQEDARTESVCLKSVPEVISSAQKLMAGLQNNRSVLSMYVSLWDRLEQVHSQIDDKHSETCRAVFCSLVGDADVGTRKLQDTNRSLIAVADTTMRCYALHRRLDKFVDAYSFILDA